MHDISVSQITTDVFHVNTSRYFSHSWRITGFVTRLARQVPQVDQELLTIVVCPFVLFPLAIVLSVLLRFTDSDYPFGIFKLFELK
jgi:hypothetical protein